MVSPHASERTFRVTLTRLQDPSADLGALARGLSQLIGISVTDAEQFIVNVPCDIAVGAPGQAARRLQLGLERLGVASELHSETPIAPGHGAPGASLRAGGAAAPWESHAPQGHAPQGHAPQGHAPQDEAASSAAPSRPSPRYSTGMVGHLEHIARPTHKPRGADRPSLFDLNTLLKALLAAAMVAFIWWWRDPRVSVRTEHGAHTFAYRTRVLGPSEGSGRPLIIALHGNGDTPAGFDESLFADFEADARVAIIRGPISYTSGRIGGKAWPHIGAEIPETGEALHLATKELARKYDTPCKPIVVGFSGGAGMAYYLAGQHPLTFSTILPLAGHLVERAMPTRVQRDGGRAPVAHALHGKSDSVLRHRAAAETVRQLNERGLGITLETYKGGHLDIFRDRRPRVLQLLNEAIARCRGRYPL